jgi:hypothetical protein
MIVKEDATSSVEKGAAIVRMREKDGLNVKGN